MKPFFLPAPIDGINLRKAPHELALTEARELENYLIFDWGIREAGNTGTLTNPGTAAKPVKTIIPFKSVTGTAKQLICTDSKVYVTSSSSWGSTTDKTGALTITLGTWQYEYFNKKIFLHNGTDDALVYDIAGDTLAASGFTGLSPDDQVLICPWNYKNRLYSIEQSNPRFAYTNTNDAVSGAMTLIDLAPVLLQTGPLLFGTGWSVNQGLSNEELCVFVSAMGDVLVYSGDNPSADNWQLVNRVSIPMPIGNRAFLRFGQDVLIVTARGVVSLARVIAAQEKKEEYFVVSSKLGNSFSGANVKPAVDPRQPFIYFAGASAGVIYVLNYERGAWSTLRLPATTINTFGFFDSGTEGQYLIAGMSDGSVIRLDDSGGNTMAHTWRPGYFDFGTPAKKQITAVRVVGRNISGADQFSNTVNIGLEFLETLPADTRTTTGIGTFYTYQELQPPGIGKFICPVFAKASTGERNEINGAEIYYEEGGFH